MGNYTINRNPFLDPASNPFLTSSVNPFAVADLGFMGIVGFSVGFLDVSMPSWLCRAGESVGSLGSWGGISLFGSSAKRRAGITNLINWRMSRVKWASGKGKKQYIPEGVDYLDKGQRGASMLRDLIGLGNKISEGDFDKVFEKNYGPHPKKENYDSEEAYNEAASQYEGMKDRERPKFNFQLTVVRDIVAKYLEHPEMRAELKRRLSLARTPAEKAKAFLNPVGDDNILFKELAKFVTGLKDANDYEGQMENWKAVADYFENELGAEVKLGDKVVTSRSENVLDTMIGETMDLAGKKGIPEPTTINMESVITKFTDRGYTVPEAKAFLEHLHYKGEADDAVKYLHEQKITPQIEAYETKRTDAEKRIAELEGRLKEKQDEAKSKKNKSQEKYTAEAESRQIEQDLDGAKQNKTNIIREIESAKKQRADQFLKDVMQTAPMVFGKSKYQYHYDGSVPKDVYDVNSAIEWMFGEDVMPVPKEETVDTTPPKTAEEKTQETKAAKDATNAAKQEADKKRAAEIAGRATNKDLKDTVNKFVGDTANGYSKADAGKLASMAAADVLNKPKADDKKNVEAFLKRIGKKEDYLKKYADGKKVKLDDLVKDKKVDPAGSLDKAMAAIDKAAPKETKTKVDKTADKKLNSLDLEIAEIRVKDALGKALKTKGYNEQDIEGIKGTPLIEMCAKRFGKEVTQEDLAGWFPQRAEILNWYITKKGFASLAQVVEYARKVTNEKGSKLLYSDITEGKIKDEPISSMVNILNAAADKKAEETKAAQPPATTPAAPSPPKPAEPGK